MTAQSPSETRILVCARTWRIRCRSSSLETAPSTSVDIHVLGELLGVHQRALDHVDVFRQLDQALVDVEERHVAAGAAVQPDRGQRRTWLRSSSALPHQREIGQELAPFGHLGHRFSLLRKRAGGADLHALAAAGAAFDSCPRAAFRSVITRQSMPRAMTSQVCAPSISSQTRTQRVHRMQRLWSTTKRSWRGVHRQVADTGRGSGRGSCPASAPCVCSSQWPLATQTEQM